LVKDQTGAFIILCPSLRSDEELTMFQKTPSLKQSHLYAIVADYDVIAKRQNNPLCLKETFFAEAISSYAVIELLHRFNQIRRRMVIF
jgi:hypothetical protein